jgi:hypothetical protein
MSPESNVHEPGAPSPETVETLFQMIMGFRITQMIYVVARLSIADLLKAGPQDVEALAQTTHTNGPSLYRLLRALAGLGIFAEDEQGRFTLTPLAELLQSGVPGSMRSRALHFGGQPEWQSWGELLYSITTGETAFRHVHGMDPWEYRAKNPELDANFNDFMYQQTATQTAAVIAAYDFSAIGTVVDVGGGYGALIAAILQENPQMRGILCDAPHVVRGAPPTLEAAGVSDRCELVPCNFFDSVPQGGDAYILKSIIHDWDEDSARAILTNCRRVIPQHGRLILVEHVIQPGNDPQMGKLVDLQMLVALGGRERTEAEFRALLGEAGFALTNIVPTQAHISVIEAVPI